MGVTDTHDDGGGDGGHGGGREDEVGGRRSRTGIGRWVSRPTRHLVKLAEVGLIAWAVHVIFAAANGKRLVHVVEIRHGGPFGAGRRGRCVGTHATRAHHGAVRSRCGRQEETAAWFLQGARRGRGRVEAAAQERLFGLALAVLSAAKRSSAGTSRDNARSELVPGSIGEPAPTLGGRLEIISFSYQRCCVAVCAHVSAA